LKSVPADKAHLSAYIPSDEHLVGCAPHDVDLPSSNESEEVKLEKQRRLAFRTEAMEWRSAQQWCDYIDSQREQRRILKDLECKHSSSVSRSPESNGVQTTGSKRRKRDYGPGPVAHAANGRKLSRQSSNFYGRPPTQDQTPTKVSKRKPSSRISMWELREADDASPTKRVKEEYNKDSELFVSPNPKRAPAIARAEAGMCNIIVGKERTPFLLATDALGVCDELSDLVNFTDELGSHVKLDPEVYRLFARSFMPLFDYLRNGDFYPALTSHRGQVVLQDVHQRDDADRVAGLIADAYYAASLLKMVPLQALCL